MEEGVVPRKETRRKNKGGRRRRKKNGSGKRAKPSASFLAIDAHMGEEEQIGINGKKEAEVNRKGCLKKGIRNKKTRNVKSLDKKKIEIGERREI